ncbi:MAG: UvrB/UvrC motif-containing protein [Patescibacteria group bacterium]
MTLEDFKKIELPRTPGVYLFRKGGEAGAILYIGKATSLAERVRSYFSPDLMVSRGPRLVKMLEEADTITFETADSVLEALILEAKLIKKHQPEANSREKDDKSYWYVVLMKEDFPRVLMVRGKELFGLSQDDRYLPEHLDETYGPFPQASELKEAMKIIRRIFSFRDTCELGSARECFNARISLCPGVCSGKMGKEEYRKIIRRIKLFFEGKKREIVLEMQKEMFAAAETEQFEKAAYLRNKIFALEHIQDVALMKRGVSPSRTGYRIEAYDAAHISGTSLVGVMTVATGGELDKSQYRKFKIRVARQNDDNKTLEELLSRRLKHSEWPMPDLIVVDGSTAQKNTAERVLKAHKLTIPVAAVVKNAQHKPSHISGDSALVKDHKTEILLANAEAHRFAITYHKKLRDQLP